MFVMAEVATLLFEESPVMFAKFLRANQYPRKHTVERSVVDKCAALGISGETSSGGSVGVTLLPATTVEACLFDRRRNDLVKPFKLSLLNLASQEAERHIAAGHFELALPVALDVVRRGQDIYPPKPKAPPAVELFPAYLLAAEANAGVGRANAAEDFLGLARWLALGNPELVGDEALARMHELFGDLRSSQRRMDEAAAAFAEETYHRASAHGPEDVRTTFGYLRLARCFENTGHHGKCVAFCRTVCDVWLEATVASNLGAALGEGVKRTLATTPLNAPLPLRRKQTLEGVESLMWARNVLMRGDSRGDGSSVGDAVCAADASLAAGCALLGLVANGGSDAAATLARATTLVEEALGEYPAAETERVGLAERALAAAAAAMDGVADGDGRSRRTSISNVR